MCVRADYKSNLYPPLGIFKQTMIHKKLGMDKDYLATKAIPFLFPLAVEPGLNLSQVTVLTYLLIYFLLRKVTLGVDHLTFKERRFILEKTSILVQKNLHTNTLEKYFTHVQ